MNSGSAVKVDLRIKVCGMKDLQNRQLLETLPIDILGFIFYPPSPRYIGNQPADLLAKITSTGKEKAGVFVDESTRNILSITGKFELTHVQLHGDEKPEQCTELRKAGLKVIKVFRVNTGFIFSTTEPYTGVADYFLFDTRAEQPGGTGKKFNWQILESYQFDVPFFLSGGIGPEDAGAVAKLQHPMLYGLDLNSGFEDEPGKKNFEKLKVFLDAVHSPPPNLKFNQINT
jgi:phosphoribosylanthranilate isomerase